VNNNHELLLNAISSRAGKRSDLSFQEYYPVALEQLSPDQLRMLFIQVQNFILEFRHSM